MFIFNFKMDDRQPYHFWYILQTKPEQQLVEVADYSNFTVAEWEDENEVLET